MNYPLCYCCIRNEEVSFIGIIFSLWQAGQALLSTRFNNLETQFVVIPLKEKIYVRVSKALRRYSFLREKFLLYRRGRFVSFFHVPLCVAHVRWRWEESNIISLVNFLLSMVKEMKWVPYYNVRRLPIIIEVA